MSVLHAIILGIIQGLTEFLPISSSGHLILVPTLLKWHEMDDQVLNKVFDIALHFGTFLAVVTYFWRDIGRMLRGLVESRHGLSPKHPERRLAWMVVISSIPAVLVGVKFEHAIETKLGAPLLISIMMVAFGLLLGISELLSRRQRNLDKASWRDSVLIGLAQAVALIPGVSRSGITITAGLALGLEREAAARYSFLIAIPVVGGAALYEGMKLLRHPLPHDYWVPFGAGVLAATLAGFAAIGFLLSFLRRRTLYPFVWYRLIAGAAMIAFFWPRKL